LPGPPRGLVRIDGCNIPKLHGNELSFVPSPNTGPDAPRAPANDLASTAGPASGTHARWLMNVWETDLRNLETLRSARLCCAFAIAALLGACGGGGSSTASTATLGATSSATSPAVISTGSSSTTAVASTSATNPASGVGTENPAPQISGRAATTVKVGQSYSFQPSVRFAGSHVLTFSVSGAPDWLTFNPTTGRLSGTPTSADVGTDKAMVLKVSNGTSSVSLAPFSITVLAAGASSGNVSLSWQPPTENTNGSALLDLAGYVIHYGTVSKIYTAAVTITNPGLTSFVVEDLPAGTYYFSMTSTTTSGEVSALSTEASVTIT